jgi:hypothetical protein
VAASGAARLYLGRVRISLMGGAGLNDDAKRSLGQWSAGLSVDLGFLWP